MPPESETFFCAAGSLTLSCFSVTSLVSPLGRKPDPLLQESAVTLDRLQNPFSSIRGSLSLTAAWGKMNRVRGSQISHFQTRARSDFAHLHHP